MKISKLRFLLSFGFLFFVMISSAQNQAGKTPFSIRLEPMEFQGFPKIQSFAYGEWNGKWVLIGGRIDGLHRKQPWAAFDQAGQNRRIYVIDPSTGKIWNKVLRELPVSLAEQLQSTNMQFVQKGDLLFITGGYGFSDIKNDHTTFPYLTIVDLPGLIQAIIDNTNLTQYFIQVKDSMMAVAGGRMAMSGDSLLLVGGHRFEGRYNPHGPDHGPGFVQEYTNEIRIFSTDITSGNCLINHINFLHDSINLHRRDYNLVPQVAEDNTQKFTIFSGVFQYGKDIPFTNLVDITSHGIQVVDSFQQKFSHYHCAVMPMYDSGSKVMYSVFFGGIARFYPNKRGEVTDDLDVPFTNAISVVERSGTKFSEWLLPVVMPGYLGASAEFIADNKVKIISRSILDLSAPAGKEQFMGYIVGGIQSSAKHIFWDNSGKESVASNAIFKVYLTKN